MLQKKSVFVRIASEGEHNLLWETDTQDNELIKQAAACWGPWLSIVFHFPSCTRTHSLPSPHP